jgi:antitoxin ParD1/3/4
MNLSLTPELEQVIQRKIDSGMYSNASEVVRDALRRMDEHDVWRDLREFMVPRIHAAREGRTVTESFEGIIAEAKKKRR